MALHNLYRRSLNGSAPPPPKTPAQERAELSAYRFMGQVRQRKRQQQQLRESDYTSWNWVPNLMDVFADLRRSGYFATFGNLSDRRSGQNWPMYRNEMDLNLLRAGSRTLAGVNQHAGGLVGTLSAYIVGKGMVPKCTPKDGTYRRSRTPQGDLIEDRDAKLCRMTQEVIDEFIERTAFDLEQIDLFQESQVDGDTGIRLFNCGGYVHTRAIYSEQVRQPSGAPFDEYGFGVRTPQNDPQYHLAYYVANMDGTGGEEVPNLWTHPDCNDGMLLIQGFAPNPRRVRGIKRGVPLFTYGTYDAFANVEKLARNTGIGTAVRQSFAYVRQHESATSDQAQSLVTGNADRREKLLWPESEGETRYITHHEPGSVADIPDGLAFVDPPKNPETQYAILVADMLYRSAGQLWSAPEWTISGNSANMAAYTAALVAESHVVKRWEQAQVYYRRHYLRILLHVVKCAIWGGRLPEDTLERVKVDLTPPTLAARNKMEEATKNQVLVGMGVKSRQMVAEEEGIDFDRTISDNKEFLEQTTDANPFAALGGDEGKPGSDGGEGGDGGEPEPGDPQPIPMPGAPRGEPKDDDLDPFGDIAESVADALERRGVRLAEAKPQSAPLSEALASVLEQQGFTGTITDSLGREYHYVNGKRIARQAEPDPKADRATTFKQDSETPASTTVDDAGEPVTIRPPTKNESYKDVPVPPELEANKAAWRKTIAKDKVARTTLDRYTGEGTFARDLNAKLRECPDAACLDADQKAALQTLDRLIKSAGTLPKPIDVYRGIAMSKDQLSPFIRELEDNIGGTITMPGLQSTSYNPNMVGSMGNVQFKIHAKTGAYIGDASRFPHEMELLQSHNTKYRIKNVDRAVPLGKTGLIITVIELEEI